MNVFKRKRKKNGKIVQDRHYSGRYKLDADARWTTVALRVTDKRVAEEKLRAIVKRAEKERAGLLLPAKEVEAAQRPLLEHLKQFIADQKAKGRNRQYVWDLKSRCTRVFDWCEWKAIRDVSSDGFLAWRVSASDTLAPSTMNHVLAAVRCFMQWLVDNRMAAVNPLAHIPRVEQRGKEKVRRRPFTVEAFAKLLLVAGRRRPLYLAAVLTGFRRNSLYTLRWSDVHLDTSPPHIELQAENNKNRTTQVQVLRDDLVAELREIRANDSTADGRVFADILPRWGCDFLRADLKRAGVAYLDKQGRRLDFHAFRHTASTWAGETGIAGPLLQKFTGHKSASQVARYVHDEHLQVQQILDQFPRFDSEVGTHIGTHDQVSKGHNQSEPVAVGGIAETLKSGVTAGKPTKKAASPKGEAASLKATPTGFEPVFSG